MTLGRRAALAALLLLAACGTSQAPPPAAPRGLADGTPLLLVEQYPGGPLWADASSPRLHALYADGMLLSVARVRRSRVADVTSTPLDPARVDALWATFVQSGLRVDGDLQVPDLFDRPVLALSSTDGARRTTLLLPGLSRDGDAAADVGGPPVDQRAVRQAARAFLASIDAAATGGPWTPDRLAVFIAAAGPDPARKVGWTGALDLATAGAPVRDPAGFERCLVVTGRAVGDLARAAGAIPPDGLAVQDGTPWLLDIRVLFPDEPDPDGCPVVG